MQKWASQIWEHYNCYWTAEYTFAIENIKKSICQDKRLTLGEFISSLYPKAVPTSFQELQSIRFIERLWKYRKMDNQLY